MEISTTDKLLCCIFGLVIFLLFVSMLYINIILPFTQARKYIKAEIDRSDGEEYYYWKRELRNLYIEHIPILGWFIRRFKR